MHAAFVATAAVIRELDCVGRVVCFLLVLYFVKIRGVKLGAVFQTNNRGEIEVFCKTIRKLGVFRLKSTEVLSSTFSSLF